jgi:hypothetical protein
MSRVAPRYLVRAIEFPGKEKGREVSYFIRDGEFGKRVENRVDERYTHDYPEAEEVIHQRRAHDSHKMHHTAQLFTVNILSVATSVSRSCSTSTSGRFVRCIRST